MIVNVAYPRNGTQKIWKIEDEKIFSRFYDKKIGQEIDADFIAPEFKGYVLRITGGSDKNGFCMKQGVNTKNMVRLLLSEGSAGYFCKREGTRKRRTVRGCIVGPGIAAVNTIIFKKGEGEIPGLTDKSIPRKLGPKRANKIRKLFNLPRHSQNIGKKEPEKIKVNHNDVTSLVVKRISKEVGGKKYYKAPRIQRLVTKDRITRKILRRKLKYETAKANIKKIEDFKKAGQKKGDAKKDEKKPEPAKDDKKVDVKKADPKKDEKKPEPKKEEKKPEPKKAEPKKEEKKPEPKKEEKKAEPKKAEAKKDDKATAKK